MLQEKVRSLSQIVDEIRRQQLGIDIPPYGDITTLEGFLSFLRDVLEERVKTVVKESAEQVAMHAVNLAAFKFAQLLRLLLTDDEIMDVINTIPPTQFRAALRTVVLELWRDALQEYAKGIQSLLGDRDRSNWVLNLLVEKIFEKVEGGGRRRGIRGF